MKRSFQTVLTMLFLAVFIPVWGQSSDSVTGAVGQGSLANQYKLDFGVPASPAFELVSVGQDNILTPTSVKDVTANFSFFEKQSFGAEFSPLLLMDGPTLTLGHYQKNNWLYNARISLAVNRGADLTTPVELAVGLRDNFIDDTDFRTNAAKIGEIEAITDKMQALKRRHKIGPGKFSPFSKDEQAEMDGYKQDLGAALDLEKYVKDHWNAQMLEVALASDLMADVNDRHLSVKTTDFWMTYAAGLGNWGQFLIGARANVDRSSGTDTSAGAQLGSRIYAGANEGKGFLELGYHVQDGSLPNLFLDSGCDLKVFEKVWVEATLGIEDLNAQAAVVSKIDFKTGS